MIEQFLKNRRLIAHYYIVVGLVALLVGWWMRSDKIMDGTIVIILAVYLLVFPVVILYTRKYALQIFLFLLAFITGFYSFYQYSVESHSIFNALYFTFQLYLFDLADVFTADGSSLLLYPLIVEIARWSAALYTISTVFIAMYRLLENTILLIYYQIVGNHYVVFGANESSIAFIEDLRKKKRRVILVTDPTSNETLDYLEDLKVVVLYHRDDGENIYSKAKVARAKNVVLLHEEDVDNLNEYMAIQNDFSHRLNQNLELTIYIHLKDATSKKLFLDLESTGSVQNRPYQVQLINLYEFYVDTLFKKYPIYTSDIDEGPVHLFIIGFGELGQHIALKACAQNAQQEKRKMKITAMDKDMPKMKQDWSRNYTRNNEQTNIALSSFDVEEDNLASIMNQQDMPITHIYICLHDDNLELLTAIELSNQLQHVPIYLELSEGSIVDKWIHSEISGTRLIYGTGTLEDVLTEENLLQFTK